MRTLLPYASALISVALAVQGGSDVAFADQVAATAPKYEASSVSGAMDDDVFIEEVWTQNRHVLWVPASASTDPVTRFGDEVRSVFGPMPLGDCAGPQSKRLGVEVDGNQVELEPNPDKPGSPLEFVHRNSAGKVVKRTSGLPKCDKPSLAGGVTFCGMNSRISLAKRDHVDWLFLCRKSSADLELNADPYWTASDPRFSRYSAIGFNEITGEMAFVDGRKDRSVFDWSKAFPPPGGASYLDAAGRYAAEELYDKTFEVNCAACHDNKKPTIIDPHAQQARVGYYQGKNDPRASFSLGNFLPARVAKADAPFRVIGSDFTSVHEASLRRAKVMAVQGHACSECHTLTTTETGRRFAADAVGMPPIVEVPTVGQTALIGQEIEALRLVQEHRTHWGSLSGDGRILPWMVPDHGGKLSQATRQLSKEEWAQLSECAWGNGGETCNYRPLFTACPVPGGSTDTFAPYDFSIEPVPHENATSASDKLLLTWRYLNGYGGVPERDDVRFNVAVRVEELPRSRVAPNSGRYPSMEEARGAPSVLRHENLGWTANGDVLLQNASYEGHGKWTDPVPTVVPRKYSIAIPAICGKRFLVRIVPKRFCFDDSGFGFGGKDYLIYYDNVCENSASGPK